MTSADDGLKLFAMTSRMLEYELDRVEEEYSIDLKRGYDDSLAGDESYYPQIDQAIRVEAASMAPNYEVFYSLETTIRTLVSDSLEAAEGGAWWDSARIQPQIRTEANKRRQKEIDTGMTPRSAEPLDFVNFGELGEIIKQNWDVFGSTFSSVKAVERVMANLNTLRGPIAHCSPLAEDEVVRLRLSVRDWFRLME
jgi:hypothetical protein